MTATIQIPNIVIRAIITIIGMVLMYFVAWRGTHDLDHVENRFAYRVSYWMMLVRAWVFMWFTMCDLFPVE
ncbi:hypothetical protein KKF82_08730 [Patescibacteria group bacterium]|nr:hypothetical protein [Patescibacteria group bacterium]